MKNNVSEFQKELKTEINNFCKILPQALELEEAVLGAMLIDNDKIDIAFDILVDGCFYSDINKTIFKQ